jgi:uncharacterized Tic20 family protein
MRTPVPNHQPGFWRYFTLAYADAFRIVRLMLPAVLTLMAASVVLQFVGDLVSGYIGTPLGRGVLVVLVTAATVWAVAPYLLVLYRCVATGEVTPQPEALRYTTENQRFGAWLILLGFVAGIPYVLYVVAVPDVPPEQLTAENMNASAMLALLAISIAVWAFTIRVTTLMPMLALDPERASLPAVLAQTKGRFWFIVGVELITLVPVLLAGIVIADIVEAVAPILKLPLGAVIAAATQMVQIAVTTRLYLRFAGN